MAQCGGLALGEPHQPSVSRAEAVLTPSSAACWDVASLHLHRGGVERGPGLNPSHAACSCGLAGDGELAVWRHFGIGPLGEGAAGCGALGQHLLRPSCHFTSRSLGSGRPSAHVIFTFLGWTSRTQFEETWATLLGVLVTQPLVMEQEESPPEVRPCAGPRVHGSARRQLRQLVKWWRRRRPKEGQQLVVWSCL